MKRRIVLFSLSAMIFSICFCGTGRHIRMEQNYTAKGSSIAIIACINDENNIFLANALTDELKKYSGFKILTQKEISEKIQTYPIDITGPYVGPIDDLEEDFTKTNTPKIIEIQKKLNVDYLYALWLPISTTRTLGNPGAPKGGLSFSGKAVIEKYLVFGELFEFPEGKEIGKTDSDIFIKKSGTIIGSLPGTTEDGIKLFCQEVAPELAGMFLKK